MSKKYELTNDTTKIGSHTGYRIKALKDFADVKAGDLGGYIESEKNLSQEGDCWVYEDAQMFGDARVTGDDKVSDHPWVFGDTQLYANAKVFGTQSV